MFKPIEVRRVFDEIAEQVRQRIYDGDLNPGDRLPSERDLAVQFGVGRMVVREALRALEEGGFIEIRKGSGGGAFVREADSEVAVRSLITLIQLGKVTIHDLMEARFWLEQVVVEQAAMRRTEEDLRIMEETIRESHRIIAEGGLPRKVNLEFHVHLARAAKNPVFVMLVQALMDLLRAFLDRLGPDMPHVSTITGHLEKILDAVRDHDAERARETLKAMLVDVDDYLSRLAE
ncbi:MAG: FadR/GntR family transcriptional regulator [Rhodospirillales bacterium]|nr:FadR/GntR family transcriptional regulator [Rhodospirillales bacterium]